MGSSDKRTDAWQRPRKQRVPDLSLYLKDMAHCRKLSRAEERELAIRKDAGDQAARERLIESCLPYAIHIARRYQWTGAPLDDLVQEANIALMRSVDRFDYRFGRRLTTYCTNAIRRSLFNLQYAESTVTLPLSGPQTEKNKQAMKQVRRTAPLEDALDMASGDDPVEQVLMRAEEEEKADRAMNALKLLRERDRFVLEMRADGLTLEMIGKVLGVSRERVRQLEIKALNKLRRAFGVPKSRDSMAMAS